MKSVSGYIKAAAIILIASPLMADSCSDNENVGYHSISIPAYEAAQYYNMLLSKNEEIQYNALCNLWSITDVEILNKDSLKGTPKYILGKKIYDKVYSLIPSKNSWVSSAAIRYINKFDYNRKAFIHDILNNNNPAVNVQLAIWVSWNGRDKDDRTDSTILLSKIKFCLQHPSWLIQQCAYHYISPSTAPYFETGLMQSYYTTKEQYKKLQVINALNNHLCDTVFDFLTREYAASPDTLLQQFILSSLPNSINQQRALDWYAQHKNETVLTIKHGSSFDEKNNFYPSLALIALQQGWDPAEIQVYNQEEADGPLLYYYLFENKYRYEHADSAKPGQTALYKKIEAHLLADNRLKSSWQDYEQTHIRYMLPEELIAAHRKLTAKYAEEVKLLFNKYDVDSSAYEDFLVPLENNANGLYKKKFPYKLKK